VQGKVLRAVYPSRRLRGTWIVPRGLGASRSTISTDITCPDRSGPDRSAEQVYALQDLAASNSFCRALISLLEPMELRG
jgi:hypothetical protein